MSCQKLTKINFAVRRIPTQ